MPCTDCSKYLTCTTLCPDIAEILKAEDPPGHPPIIFVNDIERYADTRNDEAGYVLRMQQEKEILESVLGPFRELEDKRIAIMLVGRYHFGDTIKELQYIFKLGECRVQALLAKGEKLLRDQEKFLSR